jgi:hypothetical protein
MQRAVLAALERRALTNPGLALAIFGNQPTEVQMVSLRRAVRSLERRGMVTVDRGSHHRRLRNTVRRSPAGPAIGQAAPRTRAGGVARAARRGAVPAHWI